MILVCATVYLLPDRTYDYNYLMPNQIRYTFTNQKGFAQFIVILLILGLFASVYLVNLTVTNFLPKANESNRSFLGNGMMYFTQDFPNGVYTSLCRNNGTAIAGVWHQENIFDLTESKYFTDEPQDRCDSSVMTDKLFFSEPVPAGAYAKLCIPNQQTAWVWLVEEDGMKASLLSHEFEPFDRCQSEIVNVPPVGDIQHVGYEYAPTVEKVEASSSCDNGHVLTWKWQLANSDQAVAWVYDDNGPIYQGGADGIYGELKLTSKNSKRKIVNSGQYLLHLKGRTNLGEESNITASELKAENCPEPKTTNFSVFSFTSSRSCSVGTGLCSVENLSGYFGSNGENASKICNKESGGSVTIHSPSGDVGLFQINLKSHGYSVAHWQNPKNNIEKAVSLSNKGANWRPWSAAYQYVCYDNKRISGCGFYPGKPVWQNDC